MKIKNILWMIEKNGKKLLTHADGKTPYSASRSKAKQNFLTNLLGVIRQAIHVREVLETWNDIFVTICYK